MPHLILPVDLTPEELASKAAELAAAVHELELVEAEKKEANADYSERMKEQEERIHALGKIVRLKKEDRETEVVDEWDVLKRIARRLRTDTREVVEQREMTLDEVTERQQGTLGFPDDGANDPAKHAAMTVPPNYGIPGVNMPALVGTTPSQDGPPHEPSADERKKSGRRKKTKASA